MRRRKLACIIEERGNRVRSGGGKRGVRKPTDVKGFRCREGKQASGEEAGGR